MKTQKIYSVALGWLFLMGAATVLMGAEPDAPRPVPVEVQEAGESSVRDQGVVEQLPDGRFFSDGESLVLWWEAMDWDIQEKPEIDFEDSILLIEYRDAADHNRVRWVVRLNADAELDVSGMSTLMGFEPSEEVKLIFLTVPREGVEAVARQVRVVGEDGEVALDRRVFPIEQD